MKLGKFNGKAVFYSLIGLLSLVLTFTVNWMFIILAAIFSGLGWRELLR
jgi:hypothetical protein